MSFTFNFEPICSDELFSILVKVDRQPWSRGGGQMEFNLPHVYISRHLILTNNNILVAPSTDPSSTHLVIIGKNDYMKQPEITNRIKKLKLSTLVSGKTCQGDLERALQFTVQTRLSKNWAPCGDLLIQGHDFLGSSSNASLLSVKLSFCTTETSLEMILKPVSSILPKFSLDDLGIPSEVSTSFLRTDNSFITEDYIPNRWVHVLPSLKKGEIVEIRKTLPIDSPFNSYEELKIYWLNLYGYQLPPRESGIFYVQVVFRMLSPDPMTYPSCCVRPGGLRPAACQRDRPPTSAVRQFAIDTLAYSRQLLSGFQLQLIDPDSMAAGCSQSQERQPQLPTASGPTAAGNKRRRSADNDDADTDQAGPSRAKQASQHRPQLLEPSCER